MYALQEALHDESADQVAVNFFGDGTANNGNFPMPLAFSVYLLTVTYIHLHVTLHVCSHLCAFIMVLKMTATCSVNIQLLVPLALVQHSILQKTVCTVYCSKLQGQVLHLQNSSLQYAATSCTCTASENCLRASCESMSDLAAILFHSLLSKVFHV